MATFKISQDKENLVQFRQKSETMAAQKQRSVFGILDGNKAAEKAVKGAKKPAFGVRHENGVRKNFQQQEDSKRNFCFPVAQFQAIKVYEDSPVDPQKESAIVLPEAEKMEFFVPESEQMEVVEDTENVAEVVEEDEQNSSMLDLAIPMKSPVLKLHDSLIAPKRTNEIESVEYQKDIYQYLRNLEVDNRPKPGYMKKQPDISHSMRTILVDWLCEVAEEYSLNSESLYLAVSFIDRFLSYMSVVRSKLQLVGTAAMYIASKFEEVIPPEISEFIYITDDTYTRRQLIRMEHLILKVLQFNLSNPSPLAFIDIMCVLNKTVSRKMKHLAMYISELGLLEAEPYLEFLPSMIAASAIALAQHTLGQDVWPQSFVDTTGYKLKHLKRCIIFLNIMYTKAPNMVQKSIQDKYRKPKYYEVAKILAREENIIFPDIYERSGN